MATTSLARSGPGTWLLRDGVGSTGVVARTFSYGVQAGDVPVVGDWDGDGVDDAGIFRRGTWHLRSSQTGQTIRTVAYGAQAGDVPVVGDWDGDAVDDLGHLPPRRLLAPPPVVQRHHHAGDHLRRAGGRRPRGGRLGRRRRRRAWDLPPRRGRGTSGRPRARRPGTLPTFTYGTQVQDRPLTGDWSGSGSSSVAIFRSGTWNLRSSATASGSTFVTFPFSS